MARRVPASVAGLKGDSGGQAPMGTAAGGGVLLADRTIDRTACRDGADDWYAVRSTTSTSPSARRAESCMRCTSKRRRCGPGCTGTAERTAKGQCAGIVRDGPSATVRDEPLAHPRESDFAHGCAPSRTVRTPRPPHGIQEVEGSTPFGSTLFLPSYARPQLNHGAHSTGSLRVLPPKRADLTRLARVLAAAPCGVAKIV